MCKVLETLPTSSNASEEKGSWNCFVSSEGLALIPTILTTGVFVCAVAMNSGICSSLDGAERSLSSAGHHPVSSWCDKNAWQYKILTGLPGTVFGWWMGPALLKATYRKELGSLFFLLVIMGVGLWWLYQVQQVEMNMCASGTTMQVAK